MADLFLRTWTRRTPIYEEIDEGGQKPDVIALYEDVPADVVVSLSVFEHDYGDADEAEAKGSEVAARAKDVIKTAGEIVIGFFLGSETGEAFVAGCGEGLGLVKGAIGEAVSDVFGFEDDFVDSELMLFTAKDLVVMASQQNNVFGGIGWKRELKFLNGDGGSYKVYFGAIAMDAVAS